jgi:hypothetical protein
MHCRWRINDTLLIKKIIYCGYYVMRPVFHLLMLIPVVTTFSFPFVLTFIHFCSWLFLSISHLDVVPPQVEPKTGRREVGDGGQEVRHAGQPPPCTMLQLSSPYCCGMLQTKFNPLCHMLQTGVHPTSQHVTPHKAECSNSVPARIVTSYNFLPGTMQTHSVLLLDILLQVYTSTQDTHKSLADF